MLKNKIRGNLFMKKNGILGVTEKILLMAAQKERIIYSKNINNKVLEHKIL